MERRSFLRFLAAGGAIALAPGLAACTYREYEGHGVWYRYPYGYYDYYYYPDVNVYFHLRSGYYYYPRNGVWIRSRDLPDHYHLKPAFRRRLVIRHPNPYEHNVDHRREWQGQDAAQNAINEAAKSVREIKSIYIKEMQATVENGKIVQYRVNAKISFLLEGS